MPLITIPVLKGKLDTELQLHSDVKQHDLKGGNRITVFHPWQIYPPAPQGKWAVFTTDDDFLFPYTTDLTTGYFDCRIGYIGPDKRKRRGLWAYSATEQKLMTWNNFYRQSYEGLSDLPEDGSTKIGVKTCGNSGTWSYSRGGNYALAAHKAHLPYSRLKMPRGRTATGKVTWEFEPKLPEIAGEYPLLGGTSTGGDVWDYSLRLNHRHYFYKALENLRSADLGVALAESRETILLLENVVEILKTTISPLKRALGTGDPTAIVKTLAAVASLWLTYSYGVRPLISDFRKLVSDLSQGNLGKRLNHGDASPLGNDRDLSIVGFDCGFSNEKKQVIIDYGTIWYGIKGNLLNPSYPNQFCKGNTLPPSAAVNKYVKLRQDGLNDDSRARQTVEGAKRSWEFNPNIDFATYAENARTACKFVRSSKHEYLVRYNFDFVFTQLGLNNPYLIMHELLPLSFMLDWSLKVGEFLANRRATAGLQLVASLHSIEEDYEVTDPIGHTSKCHRFYRLTGRETDGAFIKSPSELLYAGAAFNGTLAIPRAEVEVGTGVSLDAEVEGGRESNLLAMTTIISSMALTLRQAKTEALEAIASGRVHEKHSTQLMRILKNL